MGSKYSSQATSGYNSSPPPDDGTQVAANLVSWSMVKTKLADVLKTFGEAINTALVSALDLSARAIASNDTAIASDHWKTLQVTGATTIQLSSAASMGAGYEVGVFNAGTGVVTVTPAGSDTINTLSVSVTVPLKCTKIFRTNQALTGYNETSESLNTTEGTYTPTLGGTATYTAQAGSYTRIGRLVFFDGTLTVNAIGTGSTTVISGLPFTAANSCAISITDMGLFATAVVSATARILNGTSSITIYTRTVASASDTSANAVFQNGTSIKWGGCFVV